MNAGLIKKRGILIVKYFLMILTFSLIFTIMGDLFYYPDTELKEVFLGMLPNIWRRLLYTAIIAFIVAYTMKR